MSVASEERLQAGESFLSFIVSLLNGASNVIRAGVTGSENFIDSKFRLTLAKSPDFAARFVRYAPDGMYITNDLGCHYFDAKIGLTLEKDAYEVYLAYAVAAKCPVELFVQHDKSIFWQNVSDLQFLDSNEVVAAFPENKRFPVDHEGWICPRQSSHLRLLKKNMSGTPFKYLDKRGLLFWRRME